MSICASISPESLARLIGAPNCPAPVDVRADEDFSADPRFVPGAVRHDYASVAQWAGAFHGRPAVVIDHEGAKIGQGVAAWLRHAGAGAIMPEGGHEAWAKASLPLTPEAKLPPRDAASRTIWVTRARPKVDRIACPWLIPRFVDPKAVFLYVAASEVFAVAKRFNAAGIPIRQAFAGQKFSDDVHFAYEYRANRAVQGMSMGKKVMGTWKPAKDRLCITGGSFGETCYAVWKKGSAVKLVKEGSDFSLDGFLK